MAQVESSIENPLLPQQTVKFASRRYKSGAAIGLLPWRLQPEVKSAPLVRREGRWTNLVLFLNVACGPVLFVPAAIYACHGIILLNWGEIQQMISMLCLSGLGLPVIGGLMLMREKSCLATTRESWKHVDFLHQYMQGKDVKTPGLVVKSQIALKAVNVMTYSNTVSAALATFFVPWVPVALSNAVELALGYKFTYPWKAIAKTFDFGAICYLGNHCAECIFTCLMAFHCFSVCNTVVLRDIMSAKPNMVKPEVAKQYDVIFQIWRRIEILNIGINECFAIPILSLQLVSIAMATGGAFAGIKIEGIIGVSTGSIGVFITIILIVVLELISMLGETMVEMKAKLERECRGDVLLRKQVRSLRPAFLSAGSFYCVDKECIVTCCSIIIDNVVNSLIMAKNS